MKNSTLLEILGVMVIVMIVGSWALFKFFFDLVRTIELLFLIKVRRKFNLQRQGVLQRLPANTPPASAVMYMLIHGYKPLKMVPLINKDICIKQPELVPHRLIVCIPQKIGARSFVTEKSYSYFQPIFG